MFLKCLLLLTVCVIVQGQPPIPGPERLGGITCNVMERWKNGQNVPERLMGKSAKEIRKLAQKAVKLMHSKRVIDNLVADNGGDVQVLSKLAGVKHGPTTLMGGAKSHKKVVVVAKRGTGEKLTDHVHKAIILAVGPREADPDVTRISHVAANLIAKHGIAKLEKLANNVPKTNGIQTLSNDDLPKPGFIICQTLQRLAKGGAPTRLMGKSASETQKLAKKAVALMHSQKAINRIVENNGGVVAMANKVAGAKRGPTTLIGGGKSLKQVAKAAEGPEGKKLTDRIQLEISRELVRIKVDPEVIRIAHVGTGVIIKQGMTQLRKHSKYDPCDRSLPNYLPYPSAFEECLKLQKSRGEDKYIFHNDDQGRIVCLILEKVAKGDTPTHLLGKSASETKKLAQQAVALMHKKKVINKVVADDGGSIQIISKLAGVKHGPTTLMGGGKSLKQIAKLAAGSAGKKLTDNLEGQITQAIGSIEIDPDVTRIAHVATNVIAKQGMEQLEKQSPVKSVQTLAGGGRGVNGGSTKKVCLFTTGQEYCVSQIKNGSTRNQEDLTSVDDDTDVD